MSHWAQIDENNVVINVSVGNNNDPNGDEGYQWLIDNVGGTWIKTSYNNNIRERYATIGGIYEPTLDIFLGHKPYPSWIVSAETRDWAAPVAKPDSGVWVWNEDTISWDEYEVE